MTANIPDGHRGLSLWRFLLTIAMLSLCCSTAMADEPADCENRRFFEEIKGQAVTWMPLGPGTQLNTWDAVLTCANSRVVLLSNRRFGSSVSWEIAAAGQLGTVPPKVFVVLHPLWQEPSITAEVRDVVGTAFYSRDREVFQKSGTSEGRSGSETDAWVIEENRRLAEMYHALRRLPWVSLAEGDVLGAWDMLWAQSGGRVEIEIIGYNGRIGGGTDVTDRDGRPTGRKRFPSHMFWLLDSEAYDGARATRVIGEVWRSTDPTQVRQFYSTYRSSLGRLRDPAEEQAEREARNRLRREDRDAFERWWAEKVEENHAEYKRWHDSMRGGELE